MDTIDGRYLKDLRKKYGYSLRALADKIYVSKSSIQRWESSSIPKHADILTNLANAFGMTVDEMYTQSQKKYGENSCSDRGDKEDPLYYEKLTELKFGTKLIILPIAIMSFLILILLII